MSKSKVLYLFALFIVFSLLSLYRHNNIPLNTFRSEIWADRAGYFIYLPATFKYNYATNKFPDSIDILTGDGFSFRTNKVITKYTYGVALLQSPFYFLADILTGLVDLPRDGFSFYYQKAIDIAASFYLVLALYLLFQSLKVYTKYGTKVILFTLLLVVFGTNLYYYSIVETGMSHVYSFFLFSFILYLVIVKPIFKYVLLNEFLLSLIVCLSILIRPINLLFVLIPLTWNLNFQEKKDKYKNAINMKRLAIWLISCLIIFLPQLIYWKYAFGSYFSYSYKSEGFSNLLSPKVIEVIFSPKNGLLPYSPIFLLILIGLVLIFKTRPLESIKYLLVVFLLIYFTSSWHVWDFGCGAGMRNMVEYYSFLSFPLCYCISGLLSIRNSWLKILGVFIVSLLSLIAFKVNYHYFGCYFGETWDWANYFKLFYYPLKPSFL